MESQMSTGPSVPLLNRMEHTYWTFVDALGKEASCQTRLPGCPAALLPGVLGGIGTSRSDRTEQNIGAASEVASHGDEPSRATATDGVVQR